MVDDARVIAITHGVRGKAILVKDFTHKLTTQNPTSLFDMMNINDKYSKGN